MKISELIESLESLKDAWGDYELLFCDQNGTIHYSFTLSDWSESGSLQLLLKGYSANDNNRDD